MSRKPPKEKINARKVLTEALKEQIKNGARDTGYLGSVLSNMHDALDFAMSDNDELPFDLDWKEGEE